jgi:hypothetical protein
MASTSSRSKVGVLSAITRKSAASEMFAVGIGSRTSSPRTSSSRRVFPDRGTALVIHK